MQMISFRSGEREERPRTKERKKRRRKKKKRREAIALRFVERGRRDVRRQTKDMDRYLRPTD